jgi:hypothetical protein
MSIADTAKEVAGWTAIVVAAPVSVAIAWKSAKAIGRRIRNSIAQDAKNQALIDSMITSDASIENGDLHYRNDATSTELIIEGIKGTRENHHEASFPHDRTVTSSVVRPQIPRWTKSAG